jgi:SAM-dependent methyltransferase
VSSDYRQAFQEYMRYRQKLLSFLQNLSPLQWQVTVDHPRFGSLRLAELVEIIEAYDRKHIQQMEEIIYAMPINPLLVRAVAEIRDYHRRYRSYLAQATSLLDIGVGAGLALQYIRQQNPHLICAGVDVRDLRLPQVDVPLQLYDGYTLPFSRDQFDVSLLFYVLHHCQSPSRVLDEAARVTRRNIILIEEFDQPGADEVSLDMTERQSHRALGLPSDLPYHLFDKTEFESMLRTRNLIELEHQLLPSKTTRPIWKYLYIVAVD